MNVHICEADHSIYKSEKVRSLGIKDIVEIDFDKPWETHYSIFKDVDKIFLLTSKFDTKDILKIIDETKQAEVKYILKLSSDSVSLA